MYSTGAGLFLRALTAYALCSLCKSQGREHWYDQAKSQLLKNLKGVDNSAVARNIILFIGDGMGLTTVTTARILRGQQRGKTGEENDLVFDTFQHVALAKTYAADRQVGDSGASATALLCGVKGNAETVGLDTAGLFNRCDTGYSSRISCLTDWAQEEGKSTGFVTTARVTHATAAGMYAHSANTRWENDAVMSQDSRKKCKDIARQLIEESPGMNINVILGGGKANFLSQSEKDGKTSGYRKDNKNLIDTWKFLRKSKRKYKYASTKRELLEVDAKKVDYLLGLFNDDHMAYESDRVRNDNGEPSLVEMTRKAIQILGKNSNGFFLMVEGGRIDQSHHDNNAYRALMDTLALEEAVKAAIEMTRPEDTLMVVTADHSSVFAFGGYPKRGNPILGMDSKLSDVDNMPYTTLLYATGPGYNRNFPDGRENISSINTADKNYIQQSAIPRRQGTHGGEDVPIYAHGTLSHLFRGVVEQSYIPHALAYAACMGLQEHKNDCERRKRLYNQQRIVQCPAAQVEELESSSSEVTVTNVMLVCLVVLEQLVSL